MTELPDGQKVLR